MSAVAITSPPGFEVTVYPVMVDPPSSIGGVHETVAWPSPAMASTFVGGAGTLMTWRHRENSDVLPSGSVAVAVRKWPAVAMVESVAVKIALPPPSVVTDVVPRKVSPSP